MIQVIHRALDILECVANNNNESKLMGEIAKELDLKVTTCANIVKTLLDKGYLKKSNHHKGYLLGNQLYLLTNPTGYHKQLIEASDSELDFLTETLKENSLIGILNGENRIVINKRNSKQVIQAQTDDKKNAYDSSTGRLLVAFLGEQEQANYIKNYGLPGSDIWPEISNKEDLNTQLNKIKNDGYVLIEDTIQIVGFAAPIYLKQKVIGSLSIYMPAFRYNDEIRKQFIDLGLSAAKRISDNLIY